MGPENIKDILAFLAVAEERSFTRAAGKLGVSQSALSHAVHGLETRLGVRLLSRTTGSVAPTEAGERLVRNVGPRFEEIETELDALSELRDKPAGTIRITTGEHAADTILWPALAKLLGSSTRTLQRRFVLATGHAPTAVLRALRLDRARDLLTDPSRPVGDVAVAAGYGSQAHFATEFRAAYGVSPTAFRKGAR